MSVSGWTDNEVIVHVPSEGFAGGSVGEESTCNAGHCLWCRRQRFSHWIGKVPWRSKWQPSAVFLPGEFNGQRSLMGYSPRGRREADTSYQLNHHHIQKMSLSHKKGTHVNQLNWGRWTSSLLCRMKLEREKQILYINAYVWNLGKW